MRVATFNVRYGAGEAVAAAVRALDADVLALQEVDHHQTRTGLADLTAIAAEAMGAVSARFLPTLIGTPGRAWMVATADAQAGQASFGVALLSRFPVRGWRVCRLPGFRPGFGVPLTGGRRIPVREEPRAALIGEIDTPVGSVTVASTHLAVVPGWGHLQLRALLADLASAPAPVLILGDLNLTRSRAATLAGYVDLSAGATFPAGRPWRRLDHALLRGSLGRSSSRTVRLEVSDHRALVLEVYPAGS